MNATKLLLLSTLLISAYFNVAQSNGDFPRLKNKIYILASKVQNRIDDSYSSREDLVRAKRKIRAALDIITMGGRRENKSCTFHEHPLFYRGGGATYKLSANQNIRNFDHIPGNWNDVVSAITLSRGCSVTVYEHADFRGNSKTFYQTAETMYGFPHDQVSSAVCACN